jgi:predicted nucleic acid-binding protein
VTVVVDASAVVEVILSTPTGDALTGRLAADEIVVPDILDADVASAIRRACRLGRMSEHEAAGRLDVLVDWPVTRLASRFLLRGTRRWWPNVSVHDALYLAAAEASGSRVLTCDGRLARAPGLGVRVEDVRVT